MKYVYPALFEPAEEGGYNVSVPDIPGCFTCADSMPEAIRMAEDALSMMLASYEDDGETIPVARTLAEIRKDDSEVLKNVIWCDLITVNALSDQFQGCI